MALIKCPECGKEVSDRAGLCPVCGYPIAAEKNKGKIRLKLGTINAIGGKQTVTISADGKEIWCGKSGEVAEFEISKKTNIKIAYAMSATYWGSTCEGVIDPEKGNKYAVAARPGLFNKVVLTFQQVDIIDSE